MIDEKLEDVYAEVLRRNPGDKQEALADRDKQIEAERLRAFRETARRVAAPRRSICSRSASDAPARSGSRRSVSWRLKRQVRSLPSAAPLR